MGWEQEPLLDALAERQFDIYGVHYSKDYYKGAPVKDVFVVDLRDLESILAYADRIKPDAVISDQCDYSHFAQACIAERYGLPGPRLAQAQLSANKYLQRMRCREAGVLVPDFALCATLKEAKTFAKSHGFPIVLKPTDNRGSFGVNRVDSDEEITDAFFDAIANSHSRLILAENFISGTHVTVDGYAFAQSGCRSLALASKKLIGTRRQVALDILYPGEIEPSLYQKTMWINETACSSLGYCFGMTHCEYMLTPENDVFLIEAANRGGGVYTSEVICPAVSGIDLVSQYISDVLGETRDLFPDEIQQNQTILKFFSFQPGVIKDITGIDEIHGTKGVLRFRLAVQPGQTVFPITTDANRHGFVIFKDPEDIRSNVDKLLQKLEVKYV